jgi:tetratricopeptide (TPR) repeat protein
LIIKSGSRSATLLCAALASVVLVAGPQDVDPATDYKRLIDEYSASGADSVPKALLRWPYDRLLVALEETVSDRKPTRDAPFHPAVTFDGLFRWLGGAATAHLEAARLAFQNREQGSAVWQIDAGRMQIHRLVLVAEATRTQRKTLTAGELRAIEAGHAFAARWLAAGGILLHGTGDLGSAARHFDFAVGLYPNDAALRLGLGTVQEMAGGSTALTYLASHGPPGRGRQDAEHYRRRLLSLAVEAYGASLKLDPNQPEGRLRLGRTQLLQNRRREAAATLESVRSAKPSPSFVYQACTLLARIQHEAGRAANAERLYLEALAAWPDGQRAAIGLSHDALAPGTAAHDRFPAPPAESATGSMGDLFARSVRSPRRVDRQPSQGALAVRSIAALAAASGFPARRGRWI